MTQEQNKNSQRCFVIAEAGVNHNGDLDLAKKLVDVAKEAGADAVKFQTFKSEAVTSRFAQQAEYQTRNIGVVESQLEMLKKLELNREQFAKVAEHSRNVGIEFMSTAFDLDSLDDVLSLGVTRLKIPSGEITNPLLLRATAKPKLPLIISTGMASLAEIEWALVQTCAAALDLDARTPNLLSKPDVRAYLTEKIQVLHCVTEYPAPFDQINLRAMDTIGQAFGVRVGYSDHTQGIAISLAAVARGAKVIEKHFTLDRNLPGPDHKASLEPGELIEMVRGIRHIEASIGDGWKLPVECELPNIKVARRSLVAAKAIAAGEVFSAENLTVKRPGNGISAIHYDSFLGRSAARSYQEDELIDG